MHRLVKKCHLRLSGMSLVGCFSRNLMFLAWTKLQNGTSFCIVRKFPCILCFKVRPQEILKTIFVLHGPISGRKFHMRPHIRVVGRIVMSGFQSARSSDSGEALTLSDIKVL